MSALKLQKNILNSFQLQRELFYVCGKEGLIQLTSASCQMATNKIKCPRLNT